MAKITKSDCAGCEDNFYNGNNPYGVKECCRFRTGKLIRRKRVGMDDVPPWDHQLVSKLPDCYRQKGYVFVEPNRKG